MKKELIAVLLGIVSISMLSSLLSGYGQIEVDKVLLDTVIGAVGAGNFSYWQLGHTGPLFVELTSLTGDADLYVSDSARPSFEADKNNFSSTTCGVDYVNIPADFPRPIGIGVFGDWSCALSEYSIQVFLVSGTTQHYDVLPKKNLNQDTPDIVTRRSKDRAAAKKEEEEKPRHLKFLSILDTFFEMLLL